jgi:hypothetical protein
VRYLLSERSAVDEQAGRQINVELKGGRRSINDNGQEGI